MNDLVMIIKRTVVPNFLNIRTSIKAYDRDALCCGAPCWRWVYHALQANLVRLVDDLGDVGTPEVEVEFRDGEYDARHAMRLHLLEVGLGMLDVVEPVVADGCLRYHFFSFGCGRTTVHGGIVYQIFRRSRRLAAGKPRSAGEKDRWQHHHVAQGGTRQLPKRDAFPRGKIRHRRNLH